MDGRVMNGVRLKDDAAAVGPIGEALPSHCSADTLTSQIEGSRIGEARDVDPEPENGVRILLVDDDKDTLEVTALILRLCGYEVVVAQSGASAVAVAAVYCPDVALLDLCMPGMDGFAVAAKLKEVLSAAPPRLIAFTSFADETSVRRSRQAGFARYLVKPVNLPSLLEAIEADDSCPESAMPTLPLPATC
jgi:CheY-like chemotaxis protein